jgi:outer membrane protein assembly factor BamB
MTCAVFALSLAADSALGCSCFVSPDALTPEQARAALVKDFDEAFAVFTGEVVALDVFEVTLKVDKLWKGGLRGGEVVMPTGATKRDDGTYSISTCDYNFTRGEKYLIFAYGDSAGTMLARKCSRTKLLAGAEAEIVQLDTVGPHERMNHQPPGEKPGAERRQ